MKATLLVVSGNTTKRQVPLRLPCVLGRSREADVTVAHPLISRRHCRLSETDGLLMLRDLDSLNGTMMGGRRVVTAPLLPDAEFTIGPLTFRVLYEYQGDPASLPPTSYFEEAGTAAVDPAAAAVSPQAPSRTSPRGSAQGGDAEIAEVPDFAAWADADPDAVAMSLPVLRWQKPIADKAPGEPLPPDE